MIEASPEIIALLMFVGLLAIVMTGIPLGFALGGVAMVFGLLFWGPDQTFGVFYTRLFGILTSYPFLAAPLFIFMGLALEKSGVAERLYSALYVSMGGVRGGLALVTIMLGTILAAAVGMIGASVVMLGLIALPAMLKRGYDKELASGSVCAGGTLGILIPPSIMLVIYGPTAGISVGRLFMAAFMPGLLLAFLYMIYIITVSYTKPGLAPPPPPEDRTMPVPTKLKLLAGSLIPTLLLILAVLGSIFFGIAAPTEAAAVGALGAAILATAYRNFSWGTFKEVTFETMGITCIVILIAITASMFTSIFLGLHCGDVVTNAIIGVPFGRWGSFAVIMFLVFILGMFIDWIGILFIMVPLITPIGTALGFDPIWFAMMVIINLQMSFLTPPFAYALFFLKGICRPEWGVETRHIIRGVIPFVIVIMISLALCIFFPEIILWLPGQMAH